MKEKLAGLARYGDVGHSRKRRRSGLGGVGRHEDGMGGEMKSGERAPSDLLLVGVMSTRAAADYLVSCIALYATIPTNSRV